MGTNERVQAGGASVPTPEYPGRRAAASAPAKCILLGEHAVVYGEPCLSVALDRRTSVVAERGGDRFRVNGYPMSVRHHAFIASAVTRAWDDAPLRFRVKSRVPSAGGLGSSAALTVATIATLERLRGEWEEPRIARLAYEAEHDAQSGGSPNDTSVSTAGGTVFVSPAPSKEPGVTPLWRIERDDRTWVVHRAPPPRFGDVGWVVGHTGVRAATKEQVAKVRRHVESAPSGRHTIEALGRLAREALDALRMEDAEALGRLMDRAQEHLAALGVSHPALDRLITAARAAPGTLGAKLTGAGGGGAMVALTRNPRAAAAAIRAAGGRAFPLKATTTGIAVEPTLEAETGAAGGVAA